MPWVKRLPRFDRYYWILYAVASLVIGVLIGYEQWGTQASIITVVEKQLGASEAKVLRLEKRLQKLEARLGLESTEVEDKSAAKLH